MLRSIKQFCRRYLPSRKFIYLFLNGFLLASVIYFRVEDNYEKQVVLSLANYIRTNAGEQGKNEDSLLIQSLKLTHFLGERRLSVFEESPVNSLKAELIHPITFDLITAQGACGSFSYILTRVLQELGFETRIAEMEYNGRHAVHMVVEAKTSHGWVVLDPIYSTYYVSPDGRLAGYTDIQSNWAWYSKQTAPGYNPEYCYQGVRYTNWKKIPVLMPAIKWVLGLTMGQERVATLSLRVHLLRKYHVLFVISSFLYVSLCAVMVIYFRRTRLNRVGSA